MKIIERVKPYWACIASAAMVAGALAVVLSTGPDVVDVPTRTGQLVAATLPEDQAVGTGTLKTPDYDITVSVTAPIDPAELDDFDGRADPTSGSYLGLRFQLDPRLAVSVATANGVGAAERPVSIAVYADGRRYPLPEYSSGNGYLAVAGRPHDVSVEITVDGIRQTVQPSTGRRVTGKAAGLYVPTSSVQRPGSCGAPTLTRGFRYSDYSDEYPPCRLYNRGRTAYVDGLGLAAPGHLWQYVQLDVETRLFAEWTAGGRPDQSYRSVSRTWSLAVTIDGRPSVGSPRTNAGAGSAYAPEALALVQVRQDAPPSTVQVVATYRRLLNNSSTTDAKAPIDPDVSVTWTETLS